MSYVHLLFLLDELIHTQKDNSCYAEICFSILITLEQIHSFKQPPAIQGLISSVFTIPSADEKV